MRCLLITMLISFTTIVAPAAELTLQEAVASALADNPEIRAASERSAAAAERLDGGKRHRLPKIGLSETYLYTNNPAEVFALTLNQGRFDMEGFFISDPNNPDPLSTWITRVDLVLPVYTGGKLSARIGQAESMATAGELSLSHTREKITFETITAYVNLAKAREHQALLEKAQASTAEHVRISEQYAAQGMILEADVLQARIYLSEMVDLVTRAANGANLAQAALNFQMGVDQTLPRELKPLPPATPVVGNLQSWISASLEDRQDLAAARFKLDAGRLEEKATRPGYYPEIAVLGHYDLYDNTIFGANGHSGSVMAVAKINLWGGGSDTTARAAARHETASFEADIHRFEEGVRLEVQQAWYGLSSARTRHATARTTQAAAKEAVRVRESRFKQGLDKMIDLLDAETALREAEMRELVARYDIDLDTHRLRYVSGATLMPSTKESK